MVPKLLENKNVSVNLEFVYDVAASDSSFIELMIKTFLTGMPATMQKIRTFCEAADWDGLAKTAHFAKSSYSIVSIYGMLDIIKEIECSARTKSNLQKLPNLVSAAESLFKHAEELLLLHFPQK